MSLLLALERRAIEALTRDYQRRTLRAATRRAYHVFANRHPTRVAQLFDEPFLTGRAFPLLARHRQHLPAAASALSEAWAEQWGFSHPARQRFIIELIPIANHFLSMLKAEMEQLTKG